MNESKTDWIVTLKDKQRLTVSASDQWGAFDALQDRAFGDFGIITVAYPADRDGDDSATYAIRTTALLHRWGLKYEAAYLTASLVSTGLLSLSDARTLPEWDEAVWVESEAAS